MGEAEQVSVLKSMDGTLSFETVTWPGFGDASGRERTWRCIYTRDVLSDAYIGYFSTISESTPVRSLRTCRHSTLAAWK